MVCNCPASSRWYATSPHRWNTTSFLQITHAHAFVISSWLQNISLQFIIMKIYAIQRCIHHVDLMMYHSPILKTSQWQNCGLLKSWVKFYLMQPCISPVSIFLRASFHTLAISEMLHLQVLDQVMDGKMHLHFPFTKYINRTKSSHHWRTIWWLLKLVGPHRM